MSCSVESKIPMPRIMREAPWSAAAKLPPSWFVGKSRNRGKGGSFANSKAPRAGIEPGSTTIPERGLGHHAALVVPATA